MTLSEFSATWHRWSRGTVKVGYSDEVVNEVVNEVFDIFSFCLASRTRASISAVISNRTFAYILNSSHLSK